MYVRIFFHSKKKQCALYGKWTECLYAVDPAAFEARKKNNKKGAEEKKVSKEVWTVSCWATGDHTGLLSQVNTYAKMIAESMINMSTFQCSIISFSGVQGCCEGQEEVPSPAADSVEVVPGSQLLWRIAPRPANSAQVWLMNVHYKLSLELKIRMCFKLTRSNTYI